MRGFRFVVLLMMVLGWMSGCGSSDGGNDEGTTMQMLSSFIENGETAEGAENRILIVDTRNSADYIQGHIKDALNVPLTMIAENGEALYTNGYDDVSPTASDQIEDSWLAHMLINQLVNDFATTYQNSTIIFYGDDSQTAAKIAKQIGYTDVTFLNVGYGSWAADHPDLTAMYAPGVIDVDEDGHSFIFSGYINSLNYENVSTQATHHGITYKGGALGFYSFFVADIPPFCFHELLVYLGASPEGNMADGIYYGTTEDYADKYPEGQKIDFFITWDLADEFHALADLFEEAPSIYHPDPENFELLGIEPRMGGTRDSNLLWNPGCIYCMYACVCGISSNANANESTWFSDGGIYDSIGQPDNPRNYYAGRYFPKYEMMPGPGEPIQIKVTITQ